MKFPIYLDYQSTTPIDSRVFMAMKPYFFEHFGNPGSISHSFGQKASEAVEMARRTISEELSADTNEIYFTSGATESNNIAIKGLLKYLRKNGKCHIISSKTEHKSVLDVILSLKDFGFTVTLLTPNLDGTLNLSKLLNEIRPDTGLISIMYANNETGVLNPIAEINEICQEKGILFHSDATQAVGTIKLDLKKLNLYSLSLSAHKIYGPKGVGGLFIRNHQRSYVEPIYNGGGQEQGLRPGTVSPALVVGFAEALHLSYQNIVEDNLYQKKLRDLLLNNIKSRISNVEVNGSIVNRLSNNLNLSFLGIPSETFMINLREQLAVSSGASCTNYEPRPSHVLTAMGLSKDRIDSAVRFSVGRFTTQEEIEFTSDYIVKNVAELRSKFSRI